MRQNWLDSAAPETLPQQRPQIKKQRLCRRLVLRHLPLLAISAGAVICIYVRRPNRDVWMKASFATAYPALILLLTTLVIGPLNVLTRRRNAISLDLRRDVGIWAGIFAIILTVIGQNVHLWGGRDFTTSTSAGGAMF